MTTAWPRAVYTPSPIAEYAGNPFVEALPPILSSEEFIRSSEVLPRFDPEECNLPGEVRHHLVKRLDTFRLPTSEMVSAHHRLDVELRRAYVPKDPRLLAARKSMYGSVDFSTIERTAAPNCQLITGLSGVGKSTLLECCLGTYPQVVVHHAITPGIASETQVVWLKVDCPQDAGLRGLCLAILEGIDTLLGTSYLREWGVSRCSVESFLQGIYRITNNLHVGVLILDELQHLRSAKAGGQEKMLNFFVNLINGVGIPLIFSGTYALEGIVSDQLRNARRATGVGTTRVVRLRQSDPGWRLLVDKLWRYQWVRKPVPMDREIDQTLYDCTQGVRACIVRLFSAAQSLAIENESESVTPQVLLEAYDLFFIPMHAAMKQLRAGVQDNDPLFESILTKELDARWSSMRMVQSRGSAGSDGLPTTKGFGRAKSIDPSRLDRASVLPEMVETPSSPGADLRELSGDIYTELASSSLIDDNLASVLPW